MRRTHRVEVGRISICKSKRYQQRGRDTKIHMPKKKKELEESEISERKEGISKIAKFLTKDI